MESLSGAWDMIEADRAILFWVIPLVLAIAALYLLVPTLKEWRRRRRLDKVLSRLGPESLSAVVLEDGMDGLAHMDRVVAGPRGLTVVTLVPHEGIIFGADDIDRWTRVVGRRTIKFPNPIAANREGVLAVQYHLPEAQVEGLALFTGACSFPKGKPEKALTPEEIPVPDTQLQIPDEVRRHWDQLRDLARRTAERHRSELRIMQPESALGRPLLGWFTLLVAGSLAGWGLMSQV